MSGGKGYFGGYFPDGYFAGYFGPQGAADPNAMRGTAAGVASVSGTLTALNDGAMQGSAFGSSTASGTLQGVGVPIPEEVPATGGGGGMVIRSRRAGSGRWVSHSDDGVVPVTIRSIVLSDLVVSPVVAAVVEEAKPADLVLAAPALPSPVVKTDDVFEVIQLLKLVKSGPITAPVAQPPPRDAKVERMARLLEMVRQDDRMRKRRRSA
ncbi:MAG: hypothetical protein MUF20_14620 [Methylotetracoccus sp.]|jgi:hypothetical protein|nr:hypothetical protein [Methylotetracoccus sp.]